MLNPGSNVVAYPRVSTEDQAERGSSLETQVDQIRAYCDRHKLVIVAVCTDAGESSKTLNRPGLKQALAMLDGGDAAGIVVAHLDRLTRSVEDACTLIRRYFTAPGGPEILSCFEPVDTRTAMGRAMFKNMILFSELQRESIVERTRENLDRKRDAGHRTGRDRFGKRPDPNDPARSKSGKPLKMVDDPDDLAVVVRIHQLTRDGRSPGYIAKDLTAAGYPTKRGGDRWAKSTVVKILKRYPLPPEPDQ